LYRGVLAVKDEGGGPRRPRAVFDPWPLRAPRSWVDVRL